MRLIMWVGKRTCGPTLVAKLLASLEQQFWLNMLSIYETFTGVISTMRQNQFLDQLVLRLDFNGFLRWVVGARSYCVWQMI